MQVKLKRYTRQEISSLLSTFKSLVTEDCFEVQKTQKNEATKRKFRLNKSAIKKLLLSLTEDDFKYKLLDNEFDTFGPELLDVFKKQVVLLDFHGNEETITLYIKIKETEFGIVPIISFHEDD